MADRQTSKLATPKASADKDKKNNIQRGTQDELEIVGLIIMQNIGLRNLVMDRLRQAKARGRLREKSAGQQGGGDGKAS